MLNAHYMALRVVSVKRAFSLLFKQDAASRPIAEVVHVEDGQYVSYNFEDWAALSRFQREFAPAAYDWIRAVRFDIAVPRIIRVLTYNRIPKQGVKFNRRNIYARDRNHCQYCGKRFPLPELSLDHVVPRSLGGKATWDNVVCCCVACNVRKGGRTPRQANMELITIPVKPKRSPVIQVQLTGEKYASWKQFLNAAYWNVELKE